MEKHKPLRKDSLGMQEGVALFGRHQLECIEFCLVVDDEPAELMCCELVGRSTWVISNREGVVDAFFRQWEEASFSQTLVLVGHFHHPDNFWKDNIARQNQTSRFLERIDNSFLTQVIRSMSQQGEVL